MVDRNIQSEINTYISQIIVDAQERLGLDWLQQATNRQKIELVVLDLRDNDSSFGYYFVDHEDETLFWSEEIRSSSDFGLGYFCDEYHLRT